MGKVLACTRTLFFFCILIVIFSGCKTEEDKVHTTWTNYGGGPDQSKYVVAKDINKSSINQLKLAWTYSTGDDRIY